MLVIDLISSSFVLSVLFFCYFRLRLHFYLLFLSAAFDNGGQIWSLKAHFNSRCEQVWTLILKPFNSRPDRSLHIPQLLPLPPFQVSSKYQQTHPLLFLHTVYLFFVSYFTTLSINFRSLMCLVELACCCVVSMRMTIKYVKFSRCAPSAFDRLLCGFCDLVLTFTLPSTKGWGNYQHMVTQSWGLQRFRLGMDD